MFYMRNIIGSRVKQARLTHQPKMTQQQLATRLQLLGMSIDRAGISKIENGIRTVTDIEIVALAKSLQVTPGWLFSDSDSFESD